MTENTTGLVLTAGESSVRAKGPFAVSVLLGTLLECRMVRPETVPPGLLLRREILGMLRRRGVTKSLPLSRYNTKQLRGWV